MSPSSSLCLIIIIIIINMITISTTTTPINHYPALNMAVRFFPIGYFLLVEPVHGTQEHQNSSKYQDLLHRFTRIF